MFCTVNSVIVSSLAVCCQINNKYGYKNCPVSAKSDIPNNSLQFGTGV